MNAAKSGKHILVVAAHPDDEVLGVGGAMARHIDTGDSVTVLILGRGLAARGGGLSAMYADLERDSRAAMRQLGISDIRFEDFPDNAFDSVPLLNIVKSIEAVVGDVAPHRIYTHSLSDLNIDHRVTQQAVLAVARPLPGSACTEILAFESASATHWNSIAFMPTFYIDISSTLDRKIAALGCYASEMRPFPHARSIESLRAQAVWRGAQMGIAAAEAFETLRVIER